MIPKLDDYQRELGIPTVTDRLIQPALLKVLQLLIDPTLSEHGHGFRPGRPAHDAVKAAGAYVGSCKRLVVDADLAKFFHRVNHERGQQEGWRGRPTSGWRKRQGSGER
jgi:RNA-directed DNA polymerase